MNRPKRMKLPDASHLAPEDAELFRALYVERNRVSYMELRHVQWAALRTARARDMHRVSTDLCTNTSI